MLIITSSVEVDPGSVLHVGKYADPERAGTTGFVRYRDSVGRLLALDGVSHEQLAALAAAMPRPVHLGDDGYREDWVSADHTVIGGEADNATVEDGDGTILLYLGMPASEARKLFSL